MHRVLISDPVAPECLDVFKRAEGFSVDFKPGLKAAEVAEIIGGYEGLIVRSETKVNAALLERATALKAVVRAGAGVDNIDVDAASRRGILVMNTPGGNTIAAAEHTVALMLSMARNIPQAHMAMKAGKWERAKFGGVEVTDKVLGVIGLGKIGREVALRATGLQMKVIGFDPFLTEDGAKALRLDTRPLEEIIATADFITVHVPLSEQTRGLLGAAALRKAKPGVRILNVARGGIVDEKALAEAIQDGRVGGAALDVFEQEPLKGDAAKRFADTPNLILTPHIAGNTVESNGRVSGLVAERVMAALEGRL